MSPPPASTTSPSRHTSPSTGLSYLSTRSTTTPIHRTVYLYILIHGWACSATDYTPLLTTVSASPNLAPSTLFIAPDLPGHGHSCSSLCPSPTVSAFAHLINALRHELVPPPPPITSETETKTVLVGHSMGCRIALEALSQSPTNVAGIVLLDGSWYGRAPTKDYKPPSTSEVEELQLVQHVFDTMMGPATPEAFREQVQARLRAIDLGYVGRLRRDYIVWDGVRMEEVLGSKDCAVRVLVVQGTEGHGSKRRGLKKGDEGDWMRFVRGMVGEEQYTGVAVEGAGHWPHVDKVQEVVDVVERFGRGI